LTPKFDVKVSFRLPGGASVILTLRTSETAFVLLIFYEGMLEHTLLCSSPRITTMALLLPTELLRSSWEGFGD
jgi:hypothetical protein